MFEMFNYRIENQKDIISVYSNNGESWDKVLYLSYENALWLINKLRPMTFEELTNNLKFDTKKKLQTLNIMFYFLIVVLQIEETVGLIFRQFGIMMIVNMVQ